MSDTVVVQGGREQVVITDPRAAIRVSKNGTQVATRANINFIEGSNVTVTATNNTSRGRVDITIAADATRHGGVF
jgi:hypothetical protein